MIWDLHCHLAGVEGRTTDERMANLMEYADRMGVGRLVLFMNSLSQRDPTPDEFRRQNDDVVQALGHWHDRALGFAYINPNHPEESLREMDRMIANGPLVGVKLWVACRCNDRRLDPIVRRAAELKAAIFQHTWHKTTGNLPGESTPEDLAELAARHPDVPIICGHTGGDWERGIRAVRRHANVSVDTAGSDPTAGFIEMAVRELGPRRVIYGSDVGGRSFASQLGKVHGADVPDAAKKLILGENLRRMLAPILKAKGVKV
jgi:predicted TIM-barrel fold metal-dependent hydrolase